MCGEIDMNKEKVVIIGANDFQNPLIMKAKDMGYETHVFAWKDGSIGEKTADFFYPISIIEKDEILKICKEIKPVAVTTIASDLANITVQYLAEKLGLPCNSVDTLNVSTNKYLMRERFMNRGVDTPKFAVLENLQDADKIKEFVYPLIVKPTDRSGSRGINKIFNIDELEYAVKVAVENSFEKKAIVEEFIDGDEYSCECISYNGEHHFLALTKKYTTGAPHFIETAHLEPSMLEDEVLEKVVIVVKQALSALGIQYGASHSELKIDSQGRVRIIEIGSRMGGDCIGSHLVELSTGYDFVKMVLEVAMGKEPDLLKKDHFEAAAIQFIFSNEDMKKYEIIRKKYADAIVYTSEIETEREVIDSSSRLGFYIIASDRETVLHILNDGGKE